MRNNHVKSPFTKELCNIFFSQISDMHIYVSTYRECTLTILCLVVIIEMPSTASRAPHYHDVGFGVGLHIAVQHLTSPRNKT